MFMRTNEARDSVEAIATIIDDVAKVLEKSQKKGVNFPSQAAALGIHIPVILGIDYKNLE